MCNDDACPDDLRRRAGHLRRLAQTIERSAAFDLRAAAGPDTWCGPRALECENELARHTDGLYAAADGLRWHAYVLEQRALAAEARAAAAAVG